MIPTLEAIRTGGKRALSQALALIETEAGNPDLAALLDAANHQPQGFSLGLTGPPGVGKSTLTNALVRTWRGRGESVGMIAIDPSSRKTGGALLGDRARITTSADDRHIFIRSMAARDRLGGLSDQTIAAMVLMRAIFDRVLIESVGIGQSEADIGMAADSVLLCIQPASGDSLQFMKAGVMELPDIMAVTKADIGEAALRAKADVEGALTLFMADDPTWKVPVVAVSANSGEGLERLVQVVDAHQTHLGRSGLLAHRRSAQESRWVEEAVRTRFGSVGWELVSDRETDLPPFQRENRLCAWLEKRIQP